MQKVLLPNDAMPRPIEKERLLLSKLERQLRKNITPYLSQEDKEKLSLETINDVFEECGLNLRYCGYYEIDPNNPERTKPRPFNIGKVIGCSGIPIYIGVIGKAIRNFAESIYVPDVKALEILSPDAHVACDRKMTGAEIVIALPYIYSNGKRVTRMTLDLDIARKNPFSDYIATKLEDACIPYMRSIFPGPKQYKPIRGIHTPKNLVFNR